MAVTRTSILNWLIEFHKFTRYLEIGVEDGDNIVLVKCAHIFGVDPNSSKASFAGTSDEFFTFLAEMPHILKYDIVFIDGLHTEEQVDRDIANALAVLQPNGIIVLHDCNPPTAWHQRDYEEAKKNKFRTWNGTVWRSVVKLRYTNPNVQLTTIDADWGCGIVTRKKLQEPVPLLPSLLTLDTLTYDQFSTHRTALLNLTNWENFKAQAHAV